MSRAPFTSRSTGVLFWGAGYLVAAIAWGLALAALWPQGDALHDDVRRTHRGGRHRDPAARGRRHRGVRVAIWLGVHTPCDVAAPADGALVCLLVASLIRRSRSTGVGFRRHDDSGGLATVRSAWSWGLAVPTSALLVTVVVAGVREWLRTRRARPVASVRVRRA